MINSLMLCVKYRHILDNKKIKSLDDLKIKLKFAVYDDIRKRSQKVMKN